jgi:class 3 adenylate cyclase
MQSCPTCGEETPDGFRFCGRCGTVLAPTPAREVRKSVTVLFADITGSTTLGERLDAESVRRVMSRYFEEMKAVLERHEGTIEKFIGDAIMAVFGIPTLQENDTLRGVRAAVEMREALAALNEELDSQWGVRIAMRTGVNTGQVLAGESLTGPTLITGDAVNVAKRLEEGAGAGEILIGRDTYLLVRQAVEGDPVELSVKGREQTVTAYRLTDVGPVVTLPSRWLNSPLVDRVRELELLHQGFERAIDDQSCQLMTVIGAAGVGKSRLAGEAIVGVGQRATVLTGRCLPYGEGITYYPLIEAMKQAAGISDADSGDIVHGKLARLLEGEDDAPLIVDDIAQLLGVATSAVSSERTFWSVRKLFEGVAHRAPLVLVLEDVHWAEPKLLDLVEYLGDWCRDVPVFIICLARPDLLDEHPTWARGARTVQLEPLGDDDTDALIESRIGELEFDAHVRARVREAAEGNPLFVEQLLAMLAEGGSTTSERPMPPTIQSVLAARLDRLTPDERVVIEAASVMGRLFWWEALSELLPDGLAARIGDILMALVRKEMIAPQPISSGREHGFRFRHILIRDAAYAAVPLGARADLHEHFAEWLAGRPGEWDEIVGYHLEQAYHFRTRLGMPGAASDHLAARAGLRLASAGKRALGLGDMPAALNLLSRAVDLLPEASSEHLQLLPALAEAARETGDLARADDILREAVTAAAAAGDRRLEELAAIDREYLLEYTDPTTSEDRVLQTADRAARLFDELGDDHGLAKALTLSAQAYWSLCNYAQMEDMLEQALVHAERAGDGRSRSLILEGLARAAHLGPTPVEEGLRRCEGILADARGDPPLEAVAIAMIGALKAQLGSFDEARASCGRSWAIGEEFGLKSWLATLPLYSGPIELLAGDAVAAERELEPGYEALREMGELGRLSTEAAFLAEAVYAQGRYDEAETLTEISADAATPDDAFSQIAWRGTRSKTLARKGELAQAELLAREAVALAEKTDGLNLQGDAFLNLADTLRAAGRSADAVKAAERALLLYERKGNLVSAARARGALHQS